MSEQAAAEQTDLISCLAGANPFFVACFFVSRGRLFVCRAEFA